MCQKILVIAPETSGKNKNDSHHDLCEKIRALFGADSKISFFRCVKNKFKNTKKWKEKSGSANIIVSAIGRIPELSNITVIA